MDRKLVAAIALSAVAVMGVFAQIMNVLAFQQGHEFEDGGNWLQDRSCTDEEIEYVKKECELSGGEYQEGSCYAWGGSTGDKYLHGDCEWTHWIPTAWDRWCDAYQLPDCGAA